MYMRDEKGIEKNKNSRQHKNWENIEEEEEEVEGIEQESQEGHTRHQWQKVRVLLMSVGLPLLNSSVVVSLESSSWVCPTAVSLSQAEIWFY
jgi:hypothetical protein